MDCVILKSSLNFFLIYITNVNKNVKKKKKKKKNMELEVKKLSIA